MSANAKTSHKKIKRGVWYFAALILVSSVVLPFLAAWKVQASLEKRIEIKMSGQILPVFFTTTFFIRDARFEWRNKVKLISGNLKVTYDPVFFLKRDYLRVRLVGHGLSAKLLGDWAKVQGVEELGLDSLDADLVFDRKGLKEINGIEALSPAFQFRIKKSENITGNLRSRREGRA